MPEITCKKHGIQNFIQVCEHINAELNSEIFCEHKHLTFVSNVYACDECWQNFEIDKFENHPQLKGKNFFDVDEEFDDNSLAVKEYSDFLQRINTTIWCVKCVSEIQVKTKQFQK